MLGVDNQRAQRSHQGEEAGMSCMHLLEWQECGGQSSGERKAVQGKSQKSFPADTGQEEATHSNTLLTSANKQTSLVSSNFLCQLG